MAEMQIQATSTSSPVTFGVEHASVTVEPFWCPRSEEVKLRIHLSAYGENVQSHIWDGLRFTPEDGDIRKVTNGD